GAFGLASVNPRAGRSARRSAAPVRGIQSADVGRSSSKGEAVANTRPKEVLMNAFTTGTLSACFGALLAAGLAGAAAPTIRIDAPPPAEERLPLQVKVVGAPDSMSFLVRIDIDPNDRRLTVLRELREVRLVVRDKDKVVLDTLLAERTPVA